MQTIANYQMSVFGNFDSIVPEIGLMNELTKTPVELKLLPNTVNVIALDIPPENGVISGQPKVLQRIQMVETTQRWNIVIMPDRIDVNFNQPISDSPLELNQISELAFGLLNHTVTVCKETYRRIAINLAIKRETDSINKLSSFHNELTEPFNFQRQSASIEWRVMSNNPTEFYLSTGSIERINVICSISGQMEQTSEYSLFTHLDINTVPFNINPRFSTEDLEAFKNKAVELITEIKAEIEEKWNNVK